MIRSRAVVLLATTLALAPATLSAQTVLVRVLSGESAAPVFGALAYLVDPAGATVKNALTDDRGRALFVGIPAASYRVRVEMIGMATAESELFDLAEGVSVSKDLRMEASAIQLEGISVEADAGRCRVRPGGDGLAIADVWDEARKALTAAAFTDNQGAYRYETMRYDRRLSRDHTILEEESSRREGYMLSPFESRPAEDLIVNGFVQNDGRDQLYFAPDASVLLSDVFLDTHCFRLERGKGEQEGLLGLGFEPTGDNKRVVDIRGTMWLDGETAELKWLDYNYQYLDPDITSPDVGGRVAFQRMPAGTWIVPEWWIRMPAVAERTDASGRRQRYITGYLQTGGVVLEAREAGGRQLGRRVETGGFEGVAVDSVGVPIRGVRVGVVGSNQEVFTNAEGRYGITGLNPGRYQVRFVDPTLETVGFVAPPVAKDVIRGEMTELDFHMPSVGDVLFESCRDEERPQGSAILAGTVRDDRLQPVPGALVIVEWTTYRTRPGGGALRGGIDSENTHGLETDADENGFYRFCGVPTDQTLRVWGQLGEVASDTYQLSIGVGRYAQLQPVEIGHDGTR